MRLRDGELKICELETWTHGIAMGHGTAQEPRSCFSALLLLFCVFLRFSSHAVPPCTWVPCAAWLRFLLRFHSVHRDYPAARLRTLTHFRALAIFEFPPNIRALAGESPPASTRKRIGR